MSKLVRAYSGNKFVFEGKTYVVYPGSSGKRSTVYSIYRGTKIRVTGPTVGRLIKEINRCVEIANDPVLGEDSLEKKNAKRFLDGLKPLNEPS